MSDRLDRQAFLLAAAQAAFADDATDKVLAHPAGFAFSYNAVTMFARWQVLTGTATKTRADCAAFALWLAIQVAASADAFLSRKPQW